MEKDNYYENGLNAQKLFQVYETNIPRVRQYLQEEIEFVRGRLLGHEHVLELGAGYGRIVKELAQSCSIITGIDISEQNVALGNTYLADEKNANLQVMDVEKICLDEPVDVILCLQNGLSAMKINSADRIRNILNQIRLGGSLYISTYSEKFWEHRLEWFIEQAEKGLIGEVDLLESKDGVIRCKDGFTAITHSPEDLEKIAKELAYPYEIVEIDESSLFLVIHLK